MNVKPWDETPVGACTREPERWTTTADDEAKVICRACPRRWMCAREACELPRAEGLWAGIYVPEAGRGVVSNVTGAEEQQFAVKTSEKLLLAPKNKTCSYTRTYPIRQAWRGH